MIRGCGERNVTMSILIRSNETALTFRARGGAVAAPVVPTAAGGVDLLDGA